MGRKKNPAAVALGRKGGKARWKDVPPAERSAIARQTIRKRWDRRKPAE